MAKTVRLKGMKTVMSNLDKAIKDIEGKTLAGLIEAAIFIRRDMETTSPTIPVDLGNLRASFFIVSSKGTAVSPDAQEFGQSAVQEATSLVAMKKNPMVILGFGANYAIFVHENVDMVFKRPGSGAKFFESALKRNQEDILKIIAKRAKI